MSDLPLKTLTIKEAEQLDDSKYDISLKRDGTLMYYVDGDLISARGINRNSRFGHIKKILDDNKMPKCFGEMYIEGGNVFDVSSEVNWAKAKFMPIDLVSFMPYKDRQKVLKDKVAEINNPSITPLVIFETIKEGWEYILKANGEGLILRNDREWIKVKRLFEAKITIRAWEPGSDKGTFILDNGSRISGTSKGFVNQFQEIKSNNMTPIAEVEFPFMTKEGKLFQPRLRRIYIQELEK